MDSLNEFKKYVETKINSIAENNKLIEQSQNLVDTDLYTYTYTYPNLQLYVMKQDENSIAMSKNKINKYLKG